MASKSFIEKLKMGKVGERCITAWLQRHGVDVLPIEKDGKGIGGPVVHQATGDPLTAPDMVVFGEGGQFGWIEAKTKSAFSWHRITGRWVTGVDLHFYERYLEVMRLSTWPIYLLFFQLPGQAKNSPPNCPTGLFGGDLEDLQWNENHRSDRWGRYGMVYWDVGVLTKFAELDELENLMDGLEIIMVTTEGQVGLYESSHATL